jgi:hypothetical protein
VHRAMAGCRGPAGTVIYESAVSVNDEIKP